MLPLSRALRLAFVGGLFVVGVGCQRPFAIGRHDLVGERIAAVEAQRVDGGMTARAWLVGDGRLWTDAPPTLAWFVLPPGSGAADALAAVDPLDPGDATGPAPDLADPGGDLVLGLIATWPSGAVARAILPLPERDAATPVWRGIAVAGHTGWDLDPDVTTPEVLALDARRAEDPSPAASIAPGRWGRLTASVDGAERVRWMATGGTFLELDATTTDWAAGDVTLDELAIEEATPLDPGPVTVVALALGPSGRHAVAATDLFVGDVPPGVRTAGRWLAVEPVPAVGTVFVRGRLLADDTAPTGLRLVGATAVAPGALADNPAFAPLPCAGAPLVFDPALLATTACPRVDLLGLDVIVPVDGVTP